jgi:pantothenate kinase
LNLTFFVALPRVIRHQRLIDRHVRFGKSREDAERWSLGTDERNAVVIEATAGRADHTIAL